MFPRFIAQAQSVMAAPHVMFRVDVGRERGHLPWGGDGGAPPFAPPLRVFLRAHCVVSAFVVVE
jgi:hypothetical protein